MQITLWDKEIPYLNAEAETPNYMTTYLLDTDKPLPCIVVYPGGGYRIRAPHEGGPIAEFFNRRGFHAVVVEYRVAPNRDPAPLADAQRAVKLVRYHDVPLSAETKHVRRALLRFGEDGLRALLEIQRCDRLAHAPDHCTPPSVLTLIPDEIDRIKAEKDCLSLSTLAVKGKDLLAIGYTPGRELGDTLQTLLDDVIDGELPNEKEVLLTEALKKRNR
jgi:hypothetical protein